MSLKTSFLPLLCLLQGCHLGPDYQSPQVDIPTEWKSPESEAQIPTVSFWWEVFHDEVLDSLEVQAIANNPNLYTALESVVQARAQAGFSRASLFPQLNLNPNYSDTMFLSKLSIPATPGLPVTNSLFRYHQFSYNMPVDLSYQVDLWGTYRGQYDSALYHAEAQAQSYYVSLLTLTADLASTYFQMRSLDAQLDMLIDTIKVRKDAYEVNQARWDAGLVNYTDVSRAALEYTNAQAQYYEAHRLRNNLENQIAVLVGTPASTFNLAHNPLKEPPPNVPANLPVNVLMQRPDIAEAERNMASEHALIGVAYAAFLPQISLTGALGFESPILKAFLDWKSRLWLLAASATQVLFDGGRDLSNLDSAWASFRETKGLYQNQVLIAFQEVEDSLSDIEWLAKQYDSLTKSVDSATLTTKLSTERYTKGLVNYLDVVDSERAELQVQINAINILGERYVSTIQLIKAIGGTWE